MAGMNQVLIAVDQLANALFLGYADETLSARLYRNRANSGWWEFWYETVNGLFFWQKDHCLDSYLAEQTRKQLPKEYRQ
jgi:hypothetical protein